MKVLECARQGYPPSSSDESLEQVELGGGDVSGGGGGGGLG